MVESVDKLQVGDNFEVMVDVYMGVMSPEDLSVEVYYGVVDNRNAVQTSNTRTMRVKENLGNGRYRYTVDVSCNKAGRFGLTARVIPEGAEWKHCMPGFIVWANE